MINNKFVKIKQKTNPKKTCLFPFFLRRNYKRRNISQKNKKREVEEN